MPRIKRAINYINALCTSEDKEKSALGEKLKRLYDKWLKTLNLQDFLEFLEAIKVNKGKIGVPQFFGKFRAYAFEEYVYKLIKAKCRVPKDLQTFWGEKCIVWLEGEGEYAYAMEFDVSIGKMVNNFVEPKVVFEAKVELDSARLKTALASFAILKQSNPEAKCILIYLIKDFDSVLLKIAEHWADGAFQLDTKTKALDNFVSFVNKPP
ncbi:MAG: hypothetical protein ACPL0C_00875 [Candidatus Bathyarchaeales archaeon]